jgi:hypothetical protein
MVKDLKKVSMGKKNKRDGAKFELLVRHDLESKGWIVSKWQNNIEVKEYLMKDIENREIEMDIYTFPVDKIPFLINIPPLKLETLKTTLEDCRFFEDAVGEEYVKCPICGETGWYNYNIHHKDSCKVILGKLVPAKHKFCGIGRPMSLGSGFPDFIAITYANSNASYPVQTEEQKESNRFYLSGINAHIGVEAKSNGYLDKEEREKCKWLLDNNIFSKILIASKVKNGKKIEVKYEEFK